MKPLQFEKLEGLGNDFILVDAADDQRLSSEQVQRLCDRHLGVGADGLLLVLPPSSAGSRARMLVLNADGSRPEMCGNGLRCVALSLARRDGASAISYQIDTDAGSLACEVERAANSARVRVEMGRGELRGAHASAFEGRTLELTRVSVGNPHAILFDASYDNAEIDRLGPQISGEISGGSNVEFVKQLGPQLFELVVWERGVGRTLACGTGAAATAVAAATAGCAPYAEPIEIRLPGGPLELWVTAGSLAVSARGPARRVFAGEVELW
jgi:diaminopimelate epimerase